MSGVSTQSLDLGSSGGLLDTSSVSQMSQESGVHKLGSSPPEESVKEKPKEKSDD